MTQWGIFTLYYFCGCLMSYFPLMLSVRCYAVREESPQGCNNNFYNDCNSTPASILATFGS